MNDVNFSSRFFSEPMAMLPSAFESLYQVSQQEQPPVPAGLMDASPARLAADEPVGPCYRSYTGEMVYLAPQVDKAGPLALLQVRGMIAKELPFWAHSFSCDLAILDEQLLNVLHDEEVATVVVSINSPGGFVTGVERTAGIIRQLVAAGKRVIGYTSLRCLSAGYWLMAACSEVYAEGSAMVGSISSFCAGYDSSGHLAAAGGKLELFRTGELKGIGIYGKAWTDEERRFMQAKTDSIDGDFKGFVSAHRGLTAQEMNGGYWYAKHSPVGVVDGLVGSLEELLAAVS